MERRLGAGAMLTDHEPGIPGGETPPSTAGGTPAATDARFMETGLFEIGLLTGHEPGMGASVVFNPRGIAARSPGLRGTSYPGVSRTLQPTPTGSMREGFV